MDVIGLITVSVLKGLSYLYTNHKIVHRGNEKSSLQRGVSPRSFGIICANWELTITNGSTKNRLEAFQHPHQLDRHGQDL